MGKQSNLSPIARASRIVTCTSRTKRKLLLWVSKQGHAMQKPLLAVIIFGASLTGSIHAADSFGVANVTAVTVCTQSWQGATNTDMTGLYWETFKAVFEPVGINIDATFMPYKLSIIRVRSGACDIAMSAFMNEFPDLFFPQWPHEAQRVKAVHASDIEFIGQQSFLGKKVGWLTDYGFQNFLTDDIDYTEVRSEALGLRMLERGGLDYFVDYEANIRKAAATIGVDLSKYTLSDVAVLSKNVYPMFRAGARGAELVRLYDRRMAELHQDGTLDLIFEKYREGRGAYPAPASD